MFHTLKVDSYSLYSDFCLLNQLSPRDLAPAKSLNETVPSSTCAFRMFKQRMRCQCLGANRGKTAESIIQ